MKKTTVSIIFDDKKLSAVKLYMEQKGLSFEKEMEKAAEALYGKYVPANVREFLEMSAEAKTIPKHKNQKVSTSSAVVVPTVKEGDND